MRGEGDLRAQGKEGVGGVKRCFWARWGLSECKEI